MQIQKTENLTLRWQKVLSLLKSSGSLVHSHIFWVGLFFVVFLTVGLNSYRDYGISWDEPRSRLNGMISLKYAGEAFSLDFINNDNILKHYPPLSDHFDKDYGVAFELPLALFERLLGISDLRDIYFFRHLITFLVFAIGVFAVYRLGERRFSDWRLGLLAAIFLVLSPRFFAESFYNNKDVVFMALFAIALNFAVPFIQKPTVRTSIWLAIATALLIDVRIMGIILPTAVLFLVFFRVAKGELGWRSTLGALASYAALSVIFVVVFWPYLWASPWKNFTQTFVSMSAFRWDGSVLYLGEQIPATELPWHYIPVWVGISTPLFYVALFLIGITSILGRVINRRLRLWQGEEEWQDILFLGLFVSPILAVILLDSVVYDGWRHLYFIYPTFILVTLRGWSMLINWRPGPYHKIRQRFVSVCTFIALVQIGTWMTNAHPYQNVYFNLLAGREIKTNFDVDYWGLTGREALEYILEHDKRPTITVIKGSAIRLVKSIPILEPHDRGRIHIVKKMELADYVITQYRLNLTDYSEEDKYELFYQIRIDNEAIMSVFRRL